MFTEIIGNRIVRPTQYAGVTSRPVALKIIGGLLLVNVKKGVFQAF